MLMTVALYALICWVYGYMRVLLVAAAYALSMLAMVLTAIISVLLTVLLCQTFGIEFSDAFNNTGKIGPLVNFDYSYNLAWLRAVFLFPALYIDAWHGWILLLWAIPYSPFLWIGFLFCIYLHMHGLVVFRAFWMVATVYDKSN